MSEQIDRLADFILALDCGYPRADEQHPIGYGAVDAAIAYIEELRLEIVALKEENAQLETQLIGVRGREVEREELVRTLRSQAAKAKEWEKLLQQVVCWAEDFRNQVRTQNPRLWEIVKAARTKLGGK